MNEQYSEENKKKGNGLLVTVIILLVILIGVGGFLSYQIYQSNSLKQNETDKDITDKGNTDNEQDNNKEVVTELSLDDSEVKRLSKIFYGKFLTSGATDYDDFFYKKDKTILADVEPEFRLVVAYYMLGLDNVESPFSSDSLKLSYESIFGKGTYRPQSFAISDCRTFEYNEEQNRYQTSLGGCGGTSIYYSVTELASAKKITNSNKSKIEIYEYYYLEDGSDAAILGNGSGTKYYSDYNKTNLIATGIYEKEEILSKYKDDLGLYKYTFVEDSDGIYAFTSVEKVK